MKLQKMNASANHELLAYRLTQILVRLNQGEKLDPQTLADEFKVNLRTVQRDLNERFAFLPLDKSDGRYRLDQTYLGKLNLNDLERFASLAGVQGLFPALSKDFLRDLLDSRIESALLVKGPSYEDLGLKVPLFKQLEQAILARQKIAFQYQKDEGTKTYGDVEPYKLINHSGVWYMAALDGGSIKAFSFGKIERLRTLDATFDRDPAIVKTLAEEDSIWLNEKKTEVVLKVAREAASYFRRRKLIASQVIEKELEDGGLIISGMIAHPNQILPIVRYWLPNIRIISPEGLQAEMENQIHNYLEGH